MQQHTLYTGYIALVRKTHDAPEQLSKITIKGDNILYPKGVILNEEIISNNSDATPYGLEKDIGNYPYNVTSCQVYDNECITTSIPDPNNVNQDERTRLNELRETSEIMIVTENNKLICSSQTKSYLKEDIKTITTSKANFAKQIIQQSDEITAFTVNLNNENELEMKEKMLSKENEDDVTRLNKLRRLLETRAGEEVQYHA